MIESRSSRIFVSYRREDSADATGRIFDRLQGRFGREGLFLDVDSVPFGVDFRERLDEAIRASAVLLVVIGDRWMSTTGQTGACRIHEEGDYVRAEIEAALEHGLVVIPVLVGNARMPTADELPASVRDLAFRNAAEVRSGRDFNPHMDFLCSALEAAVGPRASSREAARVPRVPRAPRIGRRVLAGLAIAVLVAGVGLWGVSAGWLGTQSEPDGEPGVSAGVESGTDAAIPGPTPPRAPTEDPAKASAAKPDPDPEPKPAPPPPPRQIRLVLDQPAAGAHLADANPIVRGHYEGDLGNGVIRVNGVPATVDLARRSFLARILFEGDGAHRVRATCGGPAVRADPLERDVVVDTQRPLLVITDPVGVVTIDGVGERRVIRGTVLDAGLDTVTVDGKPATVSGSAFTFDADLRTPAMHVLEVVARDKAGHASDPHQVVFDVLHCQCKEVELLSGARLRLRADVLGSLEDLVAVVGGKRIPIRTATLETDVEEIHARAGKLRIELQRGSRMLFERVLTVPDRPVPPEIAIDLPTQRVVRAVVRQPIIRGRVGAKGKPRLTVNAKPLEILPGGFFEYRPELTIGRKETFTFEVTDEHGVENRLVQSFHRLRGPNRLTLLTSLAAAKEEAARTGKLIYVTVNCYKPP